MSWTAAQRWSPSRRVGCLTKGRFSESRRPRSAPRVAEADVVQQKTEEEGAGPPQREGAPEVRRSIVLGFWAGAGYSHTGETPQTPQRLVESWGGGCAGGQDGKRTDWTEADAGFGDAELQLSHSGVTSPKTSRIPWRPQECQVLGNSITLDSGPKMPNESNPNNT